MTPGTEPYPSGDGETAGPGASGRRFRHDGRAVERAVREFAHSDCCFLLGSPRSGTTAVATALGDHPAIAHFYEPYFLWERYAPRRDDDTLNGDDVSARMAAYLRHEFALVRRKQRGALILDKTPENAFRVSAIDTVFPAARYIHLIRDGRDVAVSIRRESRQRRDLVDSRSARRMARLAFQMLRRQPFWRNRLQALAFELRRRLRAGHFNVLNKAKWGGIAGWGPRFPGWREIREQVEPLAFHGLQWRYSVEAVQQGLSLIPAERRMTVYYEELVSDPEAVLARVQAFLGVERVPGLGNALTAGSVGRWHRELTVTEVSLLDGAIGDTLAALGYPR